MFLISSGVSLNTFFDWLSHEVLTTFKFQQNQTYDYTGLVAGRDYVFEILDNDCTRGCMTARWKNIKCGDYIILPNASGSQKYQVEEIDYYSEPADMWMALLKQVNE